MMPVEEGRISVGSQLATEAAIWSIYYPIVSIEPGWQSIPYGRPLPGQDVVILDRNLEHCPTWVTGDIYIGGCGLARQYWNDPEQTARWFIRHPLWGTTGPEGDDSPGPRRLDGI